MLRPDVAILVIDDNADDGRLLEQNLAQTGHTRRLHFCRTTQEAEDILNSSQYDIIITDHRPPSLDIFHLLKILQERSDMTPVVVLTACGTEKLASEAIKQGAYDYLTKEELAGNSIAHMLETVLERQRLKEEARIATEQLKTLAVQDSLTGSFNRRYFQERLETEFLRSQRYKRPLSIIMLDIDYFKEINDHAGHLAGDKVLSQFAETLGQLVRRVDVVARYGGDEFGIILPETEHQEALCLAQRLRESIAKQQHDLESMAWNVTASIGVASLSDDIENTEGLIARADQALYQAKESGRNRVCSGLTLITPSRAKSGN